MEAAERREEPIKPIRITKEMGNHGEMFRIKGQASSLAYVAFADLQRAEAAQEAKVKRLRRVRDLMRNFAADSLAPAGTKSFTFGTVIVDKKPTQIAGRPASGRTAAVSAWRIAVPNGLGANYRQG